MKRLAVLGSTGSIGKSTLDVVAARSGELRVVALAAGRNVDLLEKQAREHVPAIVAVKEKAAAEELARRLGGKTRVVHGSAGLDEVARYAELDMVVCGLVGAAGLSPTYAAVDAGHDVALANKEALVAGGALVTSRARETGAAILPVDSEHNALHQCLRGEKLEEVRRLWLTASGGPFRSRSEESLREVTPEEALRHPTWVMGRKITVDSATLMNKGLEVIEAHWLFGIEAEKIRVVIHPTSVVHSMVELIDGSFKAQLGVTDMRHPIQYALTWPDRLPGPTPEFDPVAAGPLEFHEPDPGRFPCLSLAYEALRRGGGATVALNAANEVAVEAFLDGKARFTDIPEVIRRVVDMHAADSSGTLDEVLDLDRRARDSAARTLAEGVVS